MGLGLVIDVYVEYLFRVMVRFLKRWNARSWKVVTAKVTATGYRSGFGCAVADLSYKYKFDGRAYTGTNSVPFIYDRSAKEYIEHYAPKSQIIIRVKPGDPGLSVVREGDLYRVEHGFRLEIK